MYDATAMCANDFRVWSHWSHFCSFWPKPIDAFSTGTLCHITPSDSGTRPNILLLNVLTSAPYRPVISLAGIRVVMTPPRRRACCRHPDTDRVHPVTAGREIFDSREHRGLRAGAKQLSVLRGWL